MFCLYDMVVYPAFGVAKLTREVVKKIDQEDIYFFELNFINKDVKILIPKNNIDFVGIRNLNSKEYIEDILKGFFLTYSDSWMVEVSMLSWNRRSKDYQAKIRRGDLREIANIYRDLKNIERNKILSFGEKAILNQVEELFCGEISVVYEKDIREVVFSIRNFTINTLSKISVNLVGESKKNNFELDSVDFYSMIFQESFIDK